MNRTTYFSLVLKTLVSRFYQKTLIILQLYVGDFENELAYPTNIYSSPGELMVLSNLPAGDYALGVFSQGTLGIHTHFN